MSTAIAQAFEAANVTAMPVKAPAAPAKRKPAATKTTPAVKAQKPTTGAKIAPTRNEAVIGEIRAAGEAATNMLQHIKNAAATAAKQLDAKQPVNERINLVMALYATDFAAVNANIKSLFKDALTLHACAMTKVTVSTVSKNGKKVEKVIGAKQALELTQAVLREAAKQARASEGMGRAPGGGRTSSAAKTAKAENAKHTETTKEIGASVDKFSAWVDALPGYLEDARYNQRVLAALIAAGYSVTRAAKGKVVKGAASV